MCRMRAIQLHGDFCTLERERFYITNRNITQPYFAKHIQLLLVLLLLYSCARDIRLCKIHSMCSLSEWPNVRNTQCYKNFRNTHTQHIVCTRTHYDGYIEAAKKTCLCQFVCHHFTPINQNEQMQGPCDKQTSPEPLLLLFGF